MDILKIIPAAIALTVIVLAGCKPKSSTLGKEEYRRVLDEVINKGNLDLVDKMYTEDMVFRRPGQKDLVGREAYKQNLRELNIAFPDLRITVEHILIDGDNIVFVYSFTATNTGPLKISGKEIPPTGKKITVSGISHGRLKDGRFAERYDVSDTLSFMQQLGLVATAK